MKVQVVVTVDSAEAFVGTVRISQKFPVGPYTFEARGVPAVQRAPGAGPVLEGATLDVLYRLAACELVRVGARDGASFRHVRKALGMRAVDVATLMGVTPETVSHWETGKRSVDRGAWLALGAMLRERVRGVPSVQAHARALDAPEREQTTPIVVEYPRGVALRRRAVGA